MFQLDDRYVKKTNFGGRTRTTIDEQFTNSYTEQGIQPTYKSGGRKVDRVSIDYGPEEVSGQTPAAPRRSKRYREPTTDILPDEGDRDKGQTTYPSSPATARRAGTTKQRLAEQLRKRQKIAGVVDTGTLIARARVSRINSMIMSGGLTLWFKVQLPFAAISILMIGLEDAIQNYWIGRQIASAAQLISDTLSLFGVDLSIFSPLALGFVAGLAALAVGLFTLMLVAFAYSLGFINGFGGRGSTAKIAALIICMIGYSLPIVNLFPWFVLYTIAVWRYPK